MIDAQDKNLVAPCGIYCGACKSFKKGKCSGCNEHSRAAHCKVRVCTASKGYNTCLECNDFEDVMQCSKFNSFFSKFYSLMIGSDKKACLERIAEIGLVRYSREMRFRDQKTVEK